MSSPRLPLSSRPTFLPDEISRREFATVFRGYDPAEVRTFLNQLSEQSADLADRVAEVQKALIETEDRVKNPELTEEMVTSLLGEQTAQILRSAREAAAETRRKTDEEVGRQLRDAHEVTSRMKEEAETILRERTEEAESVTQKTRTEANEYSEKTRTEANEYAAGIRKELAAESERRHAELDAEIMRRRDKAEREINEERTKARQESRDLIDTARMEADNLVQRTQARQTELIESLVRRRKIALAQLDSLRAGRQRLLGAYKMVRGTLDEVTAELEKVEEEARQAQLTAGQRAAEASELSEDELNQEIEMEQFELEDDVPQHVIDLSESDEMVATSWTEVEAEQAEAELDADDDWTEDDDDDQGDDEIVDIATAKADTNRPFDFDAAYDDQEDGQAVVNLTVIDGESDTHNDGGTSGSSMPSAPTGMLTRSDPEQQQTFEVLTQERESSPSMIIGDGQGDDDERALKLRRDAVVGKARSQAVRRLKRALQDEQDSLIARTRSGEFSSVQALLGSPDDQAAAYHRAVVKLLREVVRTGASSVPGSTGVERGTIDKVGTAAARALADQVVNDIRATVVPKIEDLLAYEETPSAETISQSLSYPYTMLKDDYLDRLVDERVGSVFDEGVALAR